MDYPSSSPSPKIYIAIGVGILVLLLIVVVVVTQALKGRSSATATNGPTPTIPGTEPVYNGQNPQAARPNVPNQSSVLTKVGAETLYKEDVDYYKGLYAGDASDVDEKEFLNQAITDSVVLQGGADAGFITLDETMFNATGKNYILRQKKIQDVRAKVNASSQTISGTIVSIWFANDVMPKVGLVEAQKIALQKITALQTEVKAGRMTIRQAGNAVKNDTSLADLDEAYQVNAIFTFTKNGGEKISISEELDAKLWNLNKGGVTDVVLVKATPTFDTKPIDALYMFGQVTEKDASKTIKNYDSWYAAQQKKYAVTTN